MLRSRTGAVILAATLVALVAGVAARRSQGPPFDPAALASQLQATTVPWNSGDLDAFIAPYAQASTFMTAGGPIGPDAMKTRTPRSTSVRGRSRGRCGSSRSQ